VLNSIIVFQSGHVEVIDLIRGFNLVLASTFCRESENSTEYKLSSLKVESSQFLFPGDPDVIYKISLI